MFCVIQFIDVDDVGRSQPVFTWTSPETVSVVQGHNLTLECAARGLPAPDVSWEKYGGHLPAGRHTLILGLDPVYC
jgi:Immunoglobulin domain